MLERINPKTADSISLTDHYSRYLFASHFVKGKKVLDAACGAGYGSCLLKEMGASFVTGIDISEEAIEFARENYLEDGVDFICGDIKKIKELVKAQHYDVIVSFETIEHVNEPEEFIAAAADILKKNGLFISSVPDDIGNKINNPFHVQKFTRDEYHQILTSYFSHMEPFTQYLSLGAKISHGTYFSAKENSRENRNAAWPTRWQWTQAFRTQEHVLESMPIEKPIDDIKKFCFLAICSHSSLKSISAPPTLTHSISAWHEYSSIVKKYEIDLLDEIKNLRKECNRLDKIIAELDRKRVSEYNDMLTAMAEKEKSYIEREENLLQQIKTLTLRCIAFDEKMIRKLDK